MQNDSYTRKEYSIAQCAYLAGIIEGEGSIYIGAFSKNKKSGVLYYQTNIEVSNTDKELIDWLYFTFGGRVLAYSAKQTPQNSRKPVWRWVITGKRLEHLCEIMLPYLISKKKQAEIMIKMRKTFEVTGCIKGKSGCQLIPENILVLRKQYFNELRALHSRNYNK